MKGGEKKAAWSSQFRGVSWRKASGKWQAYVYHQGKKHHLGLFDDEAAAARAYDAKAATLHGTSAKFNFPREWVEDDTGAWAEIDAEKQATRERNRATVHDGEKQAAWSSEFRGVSRRKSDGRWEVGVTHRGERHRLGLFTDEAVAARAYDAKAAELHGRKARLNFPREWQWAGDDSTGAWSRVET